MSERIVTGALSIVAGIHLLPLIGAFGVERLSSLYDVRVDESGLEILMRHRAALFGVDGVLFAHAAFKPVLQPVAFSVASASVGSFLCLAASVDDLDDALRGVVVADIVAACALLIAVAAYASRRSRNAPPAR